MLCEETGHNGHGNQTKNNPWDRVIEFLPFALAKLIPAAHQNLNNHLD